MSTRGSRLRHAKCLGRGDLPYIRKLPSEFSKLQLREFYNIPSDFGRVLLRKDGKLIAMVSIEPGNFITHVPITKCETFGNPRIWSGSIKGQVVKKTSPFCGFGGFVQWGTAKESNCKLQEVSHSINHSIILVALRKIHPMEVLVCEKNELGQVRCTERTDIPVILKSLTKDSTKTRSQLEALQKAGLATHVAPAAAAAAANDDDDDVQVV